MNYEIRIEALCSKGLRDVLGVLAVCCCGVIKKIKGCALAFYLLFLARDRFRSFLF